MYWDMKTEKFFSFLLSGVKGSLQVENCSLIKFQEYFQKLKVEVFQVFFDGVKHFYLWKRGVRSIKLLVTEFFECENSFLSEVPKFK